MALTPVQSSSHSRRNRQRWCAAAAAACQVKLTVILSRSLSGSGSRSHMVPGMQHQVCNTNISRLALPLLNRCKACQSIVSTNQIAHDERCSTWRVCMFSCRGRCAYYVCIAHFRPTPNRLIQPTYSLCLRTLRIRFAYTKQGENSGPLKPSKLRKANSSRKPRMNVLNRPLAGVLMQ